MMFLLFYLFLFSDDIEEKLNSLLEKIKRKINIIKKNQKFQKKKEEEKKKYETKKTKLKNNTEKRIRQMILVKEEKIKKIEEKYDNIYKELAVITDQKQFLLFFNKFMNMAK
jgi:hypothetical protein